MKWLICLALAVVTLAVYWPSLSHQFLGFDDQQYVTENPYVRAGLTWQGVPWAFTTFHASNWHPLTCLSHMADWQMYGGRPFGHHLTNEGRNVIADTFMTFEIWLVVAGLYLAVTVAMSQAVRILEARLKS